MKVILKEAMSNLGDAGDVVEVKAGYARNYLIPQGLAMLSHQGASGQASAMKRSLSGLIRCTAAIPKRRTAEAVRPGVRRRPTASKDRAWRPMARSPRSIAAGRGSDGGRWWSRAESTTIRPGCGAPGVLSVTRPDGAQPPVASP